MIEYKTWTVVDWQDISFLEKLLKRGWTILRADTLFDGSGNSTLYVLQKGRSVKQLRKKVR